MKFQPRDGQILSAIHKYDGVLARRHIKEMFFADVTDRRMAQRLADLRDEAYIDYPDEEQRRTKTIPEPIAWLGWRGILWIAAQQGLEVEPPKDDNENQLRKFSDRLRKEGIRWLREPHWDQLEHDLAVVDFWMAVESETSNHPTLTLEYWIAESVFRTEGDRVEYRIYSKDGTVKKGTRGVIPDGYFVIIDEERKARGERYRARFLVEWDMGSHPQPRFSQKAAAYAAYVKSPEYRARFASNDGFWLVATIGERRMKNMMKQTQQAVGKAAGLFFFSTLDQVDASNPLTDPIWVKVGRKEPFPLIK